MASNWSRREVIAASSLGALPVLGGCSSFPFASAESPLTIQVANPGDRKYRLDMQILKPDATDLDDARVVDESYVVQPTDGYEVFEEIRNRRYHVRARLNGMGISSQYYNYEYYPSCGDSDDLSPSLSVLVHPESDQGPRYIRFRQSECGVSA